MEGKIMKCINKSFAKIDGMDLVTGKPVYTEDLVMEDALVVKILRCPHAFAKIKSIDVTKAEKLQGVECVLTYKDVPNVRFTIAGQSYPEPSPYDRLILDKVLRYVGDEVAIVAAVDERTANNALKLIKVEYQVLEPILNFEEAIEHSSIIHPEDDLHLNHDIGFNQQKNIASSTTIETGDVEEVLKDCPYIVEETYYTQAQAHGLKIPYNILEPWLNLFDQSPLFHHSLNK